MDGIVGFEPSPLLLRGSTNLGPEKKCTVVVVVVTGLQQFFSRSLAQMRRDTGEAKPR